MLRGFGDTELERGDGMLYLKKKLRNVYITNSRDSQIKLTSDAPEALDLRPRYPTVELNVRHNVDKLILDQARFRHLSSTENALHASSYVQHWSTAIPFGLGDSDSCRYSN